jgi:photosystem II stability/assembly factor-like uncharacterized protein
MTRTAALRSALLLLSALASLPAQPAPASSALRWRSIGPFRGGRIRAMAGVAQQPYTFYFAQVNGGLWKTTDAGRTWTPIFDEQPTQSIGAVVVAPSDPNTLYVGSGEGLQRPDLSVGDGIYKSTDAGKTWTHLGLRDAQQIAQIAVDPKDPNRLFVAALGHPYGPSRERGVFMSTDGGKTFAPVLQKDENVGGNDVDIDPSNPQIVYANLWESRQGPWENAVWVGNGGGLFKSADGGNNWKQLSNGLPNNVNQVNLAISPSNPSRLYASVASNGPPPTVGIYRSDDGGESWTKITNDTRPAGRIGGGDLPVPIAHPTNADVLIMASTVSWKSTDGGRTWAPFKGAPGGEDYQNGWINPNDPNIVLMVADQGAVVSLNGGESWSAWYNQPTAQLYHVAADNAFPYRVCSGQQESGSTCVSSRGNYGAISVRDWISVGVDEYGYVAPHPQNPDLVFGGRQVSRFDRRTGQSSIVGPLAGRAFAPGQASPYRQVRTQPVVFSEADKRTLFFGNNFLWKTTDGGVTWKQISPDVTRKTWAVPPSVGKYSRDTGLVRQRGVIYTVGPSPLNVNRIWFGTDDGLIYVTQDAGRTWKDVTPRQLGPWWKVFMIDAGRFDTATAYAAVNTLRLDDMRPHLYKTHNGGRSWTEIVRGMDGAGPANAIREDPKKKGLLYAATEKGVYVSFDDGNNWQSLRLNLPASSVRDLIVKDDDIVVATHGRGFWILDDVTPLRQIEPTTLSNEVVLFKPQPALRVRWNMHTDMPWPKEEPVGENPPDGASVNYYLRNNPDGPVVLEIVRADGRVLRRYASTDSLPWTIPSDASAPVPTYWYRQPPRLSTTSGMHRFYWDAHYQPLRITVAQGFGGGAGGGLPINAIPRNTAPAPRTPWVSPGTYSVRLIVGGKTYTQPITVRQDPRVRTPAAAMRVLYALTDSMYFIASDLVAASAQVAALAEQNKSLVRGPRAIADAAGNLYGRAVDLKLGDAAVSVARVMNLLQAADVPVTATQRAAISAALKEGKDALAKWNALKTAELVPLNAKLKAAGLATITLE